MRPYAIAALATTLALALGAAAGLAGGTEEAPTGFPAISGDPDEPRRHFREQDTAELSPGAAGAVYDGLGDAMAAGYAASGHPVATAYRGWRRYNTAPYRSATHGRRYVNNYANEAARAYGRFEAAGAFPEGAVIAKDSFVVGADGAVRPGPLFLMEKMAAGFNYVTADWRYTEIGPDGAVAGTTKGEGAARVEYCIACHLARARQDHLYFVPEAMRVAP